MFDFIKNNSDIFIISAVVSVLTFVGTLIFIPIILTKIPENYFLHEKAPEPEKWHLPYFLDIFFIISKNVLGIILILVGLLMLLTPGQGVLSLLIGISLTNFPGKRKLERKIVSNEKIFSAINWVRSKAKKNPIKKPILNK